MDYSVLAYKRMNRSLLPLMMAFSVGISQVPVALAGPGDTNSTNVGSIVQDGTYYNTQGQQTTFVGQNGLLWVQSGTTVRGLEVNGSGGLTGNGGNMLFTNPNGMIRVDGTINASAIIGGGFETANGGTVTLSAPGGHVWLGDTGQILTLGQNGGFVNIDAGALTMSPGSVISVAGLGGAGGAVNINASGSVDIQRDGQQAALVDASGKYLGTIDTSVINIQGAVVNNEGVIRANGYVVADGNVVHLYNENIQAPNGDLVARVIPDALKPTEGTLMTTGSDGGTIRIASTGAGGEGNTGVCIAECAINKADLSNPGTFAPGEAQALINRMTTLLNEHNGDIVIGSQGVVQANGSSVNFLSHELLPPDVKVVDKGYGVYEQAFKDGDIAGLASEIFSTDPSSGAFQGGNGGVIIANARNDVHVQSDTVDGIGQGGLISARGGNGNGYTYTTEGGGTGYETFDGGNGGSIFVNAQNAINFAGSAHAFGGAGYQNFRDLTPTELAWITTNNKSLPSGYIYDNQDMAPGGMGGNGGTIAFSAKTMDNQIVDSLNGFTLAPGFTDKTFVNYRQIDASGGHSGNSGLPGKLLDGYPNPHGGLVVIGTISNPNNLQNVSVYRGQGPDQYPFIDTTRFGTVVLPDATDLVAVGQLKNSNTNFNPDATQLKIDQLREDELLIGRDTLALLSHSTIDTLWGKFDNAIVRSADPNYQAGGAGILLQGAAPDIKNLVVNSLVGNRLVMDIPGPLEGGSHWLMNGGNTQFSNLTALMIMNSSNSGSELVNNDFWLVGGTQAPAGGLISLMSNGDIINNNLLAVSGNTMDGSISMASNQSIINRGYIGGFEDGDIGASVILKACRDILNDGVWTEGFSGGEIGSNGRLAGGRIDLLANNNVLNLGKIYADGETIGGNILTYAGYNNLNFGSITANGTGAGDEAAGFGGRIHMHGRNLSANVDLSTLVTNPDDAIGYGPGLLQATGANTGGKVFVTSGAESCGVGCANDNPTVTTNGASDDVNGLITELLAQDNLAGFSTTQNTPPITTMDTFIDMTRNGSALNLGNIDTRGDANAGGETWLVGNGQVGIGAGSSINGIQVNYDGILGDANPPVAFQSLLTDMNNGNSVKLVAGNVGDVTALSAVLCSNLVPPGNTGEGLGNGGGYDFPNNFTIPGPTTPPDDTDVNVFGLFQEYRFRNDTTIPRPPAPLIIGYEQPGMFLAKAYQPVTQEILRLALLEYNRALSDSNTANQGGETHKRAFEMARLYLTDAGVDQEVATSLLQAIQDGTFEADAHILGVLQAMSQPEGQPATPTTPTEPEDGNVLRQ